MEWIKITNELPKFKMDKLLGVEIADDLLVWIDHKDIKAFSKGKAFRYSDGYTEFIANEFSGNFNITHWIKIDSPKD